MSSIADGFVFFFIDTAFGTMHAMYFLFRL